MFQDVLRTIAIFISQLIDFWPQQPKAGFVSVIHGKSVIYHVINDTKVNKSNPARNAEGYKFMFDVRNG